MSLVVQKYGGSSLKSPAHIKRAALRIKNLKNTGASVVVVVSAMGHTTDHLIRLAKKTVSHPRARELDMLLTVGERVSMSLLSMALQECGIDAISFTGSQSGIITSSDHLEAKIVDVKGTRLREALEKGRVVIVAGFQGVSEQKEITTLGRGGSDTTAVAIAAALGAERCEILTDVDGIFTADPRLVSGAKLIPHCSYDESIELSRLGAKMQARSIELAKRFNVKVWISSSHNLDSNGTQVVEKREDTQMEKSEIKGVATKTGFTFFRAEAKVRMVLSKLREEKVSLQFFNFTDSSTSFLVEEASALKVKTALTEMGAKFNHIDDVAIVSAVGEGLTHSPNLIPEFVEAIADTGSECLLLCTNALSVTAAVSEKRIKAVAEKLHAALIEGKKEKGPNLH